MVKRGRTKERSKSPKDKADKAPKAPKAAKSKSKDVADDQPVAVGNVGNWEWKQEGTLIYGTGGAKPSTKIASFDMDDTLIKVKSGAKFPVDANDWLFWHDSVPAKLRDLEKNGFKIVIFTNQNGISLGKTKAEHIKTKIKNIAAAAGVNIQAFLASADDKYRKPSTMMWRFFEGQNGGVKPDKAASFFCGDAAGRKSKTHKDFTDTDLKFALNCKVAFKTPEVMFLGEKEEKIPVNGFEPRIVPTDGTIFEGENSTTVVPVAKELIIMCGAPGSGKSTFCETYLKNYVRVNRDTLKTKEKCFAVADAEMAKGNSVVIDNTNPKTEDRAYFLQLAKKHNFPARCFFLTTTKDLCFHNDYVRTVTDSRKHLSGKAGSIPIHGWFKYLEQPSLDEGFKEIKKVRFVAKFQNEADKDDFLSYSKG